MPTVRMNCGFTTKHPLFLSLSLNNYNKTGEEKILPVVAWGVSLGW